MKRLWLLLIFIVLAGLFLHPSICLASDNVTEVNLTSSDLEGLVDAAEAQSDATILIFEALLLVGMLIVSLWRNDIFLYTVSALVSLFTAFYWVDDFTGLSIPVFGLGLYQLFTAVRLSFGGGAARGLSQFKAIINKVKGWF